MANTTAFVAWGPWLEPGPCSATCGKGVRTVRRRCASRVPDACVGESEKTENCEIAACGGLNLISLNSSSIAL